MASGDHTSSGPEWNLRDPSQLLATGLGIGLLPKAPGTWGSLLALVLAWEFSAHLGQLGLLLAGLGAFVVGIRVSNDCIRKFAIEDPKQVVIDEIAGQWLVLAVLPAPGLTTYAAGFVLFRVFDIFKPWPVSWADREIKGGLGVMVDDVLAAGYAAVLLWAFSIWMGS